MSWDHFVRVGNSTPSFEIFDLGVYCLLFNFCLHLMFCMMKKTCYCGITIFCGIPFVVWKLWS